MKVAVIGTGYVGLVASACLANAGNHIYGADRDQAKIEMLKRGELPIYEPGLRDMVLRNVEDQRLRFTTDTALSIRESEIIFIAVGTPPGEDGSADLSHVLAVARTIGEAMNGPKIVVCKSTVPVGTCDKVAATIRGVTDHQVDVVSNPEFLKEGSAVKDFNSPDRVIIGAHRREVAERVGRLYKPFMRRRERIVYMDVRSAEMTKYASNAMLAAKISFMNEISALCERVGADVEMVRQGMSMDERIGPHFIFPGVGYGGSCFPKDVRALDRTANEYGLELELIRAIESVNQRQKLTLLKFAESHFDSLQGKRFAVWGLSFKPRTDDIREAPALVTIRKLVEAGATVMATDPVALDNACTDLEDLGDAVQFSEDDYGVLEHADALFIFTEWDEFRSPDFERMRAGMRHPIVFDGRNLYELDTMRELGFTYFAIGRPPVSA